MGDMAERLKAKARQKEYQDDTGGGSPSAKLDFKPDPDSRYRREHWPAYAYPEPKKFRITTMMATMAFAVFAGGLLAFMGWHGVLKPIEHHLLYGDEEAAIGAKWHSDPIRVPGVLASVMQRASYYGTDVWSAMNPVSGEDGSITLAANSKEDFTAFVQAVRAEIDSMLETYEADSSYAAFNSYSVGMDYLTITIDTDMKQESLLEKEKYSDLLCEMKIQAAFYNADDGSLDVRIDFVNGGNVVSSMTM